MLNKVMDKNETLKASGTSGLVLFMLNKVMDKIKTLKASGTSGLVFILNKVMDKN